MSVPRSPSSTTPMANPFEMDRRSWPWKKKSSDKNGADKASATLDSVDAPFASEGSQNAKFSLDDHVESTESRLQGVSSELIWLCVLPIPRTLLSLVRGCALCTSLCSSSTSMTQPQQEYSAFREARFGHATLEIKNRTHAYYARHRNQDGFVVEADKMWFNNRVWHPVQELETAS